MFRKVENQYYLEEFILPFEGKLRADNRWAKLAKTIPWESILKNAMLIFLPATTGATVHKWHDLAADRFFYR